MNRHIFLTVLFGVRLLAASDQIPAPAQTKPILLAGATVHTLTGAPAQVLDLLIVDGKIDRLEPRLARSSDYEIMDVSGKHLYPGLIAAATTLGLVEINAVRPTLDYAETGEVNPNLQARVAYNPDSELIPVARSNGVLLANVTPLSGLIPGQSSLMMLDGWTWEEATLLPVSGMCLNWPDMKIRTGRRGTKSAEEQKQERAEALQKIDDLFEQVRAYLQIRAAEIAGQRDATQKHDLRLESLIPVIERKLPLFIRAHEGRQIEAAVHWAQRQAVRIVIVGARDAWLCRELLKTYDIPVVYENVLAVPGQRYEDYDQVFKTPALLHEAGIRFCITTSSSPFEAAMLRNLPYHAAMAAGHGLPHEIALRSITLSAAEILGVSGRVGSLEPGKEATLFIADGDPLDIRTRVEAAFIQGKKLDLSDRHKELYGKYQEKYRQKGILGR